MLAGPAGALLPLRQAAAALHLLRLAPAETVPLQMAPHVHVHVVLGQVELSAGPEEHAGSADQDAHSVRTATGGAVQARARTLSLAAGDAVRVTEHDALTVQALAGPAQLLVWQMAEPTRQT